MWTGDLEFFELLRESDRGGAGLDRPPAATSTATGSSSTAGAHAQRARQPGLARLPQRDRARRRHARRGAHRSRRGAGVRVPRQAASGAACSGSSATSSCPSACRPRRRGSSVRFNERFWMEDEQYVAMALDGEKRQVQAPSPRPPATASGRASSPTSMCRRSYARLLRPDMFSGWGVRTTEQGRRRPTTR